MSRPTIKVAICGGGVGGLVLAAALSRVAHIEVDVYEAAHEFTEIGAGIGVWPRAWKVLQTLGLAKALSEVAMIPPNDGPTMLFRKGDEPQGGFNFYELITPGGMITLHRTDFQRVLLSYLSTTSVRMHTSARLVSYTQPPAPAPIKLAFKDGRSATCDLLVGADGLKSCVRAQMLQAQAAGCAAEGQFAMKEALLEGVKPCWSGTMAYRTTVPAALLPGHRVLTTPYVYLGKNTQVTTYPIARGTQINLAAFTARYDLANTPLDAPLVADVPRETFLADFAGWEPEVLALFDCVRKTSRWAVHTTPPLGSFVDGRVVLLGDAAHAMMPYQGSGAGQAIEDAHTLATLLTHPLTSTLTLPRAAAAYDAVRRPASQRVAALAHEAGRLYTLNEGAALGEVAERLRRNWAWAWETEAEEDVRRAVGVFEGGRGW